MEFIEFFIHVSLQWIWNNNNNKKNLKQIYNSFKLDQNKEHNI